MTIALEKENNDIIEVYYRDQCIFSKLSNKKNIEKLAELIDGYSKSGFIAKNSLNSPNIYRLKAAWEYKIDRR